MQDPTLMLNTNDPRQARGLALMNRFIALVGIIPPAAIEKAHLAMIDVLIEEVPEQRDTLEQLRRDMVMFGGCS